MSGKFELYKDKAGEYRFRLKAGNGENILASEGYKAKKGCVDGIESVKKNSIDEARYKKYETKSGKYAFNLRAGNHQVIGVSQSYESASSRDKGIGSVKKVASSAKIEDQTTS